MEGEVTMKIALVVVSNGWGGAEEFVYQLAKAYKEKGHETTIITNSEMISFYKDLKKGGIKLVDIGKMFKPIKVQRFPPLRALFWHFNTVRMAKRFSEHIEEMKPDVIHFNQPRALLLWRYTFNKIKKGVTKVYTAHGLDFEMNSIMNTLLPAGLVKKLIEAFDLTIVPSKFMMKELTKREVITDIRIIPNGINFNEINRFSTATKRDVSRFRMVFPGGGKLWKGGKEVLEALSHLNKSNLNVELFITRPVPEGHVYFDIISKHGIKNNVKLTGLLSRNEYYRLLVSSDVLIMPSKKEAFGIVFLEAMALGKPIIATNMGGIPEVVEDGHNGYLCDRTPKEIARAIKFLYENPKVRKKISRINPERAKRFDWDNISEIYLELFSSKLK